MNFLIDGLTLLEIRLSTGKPSGLYLWSAADEFGKIDPAAVNAVMENVTTTVRALRGWSSRVILGVQLGAEILELTLLGKDIYLAYAPEISPDEQPPFLWSSLPLQGMKSKQVPGR